MLQGYTESLANRPFYVSLGMMTSMPLYIVDNFKTIFVYLKI